MIAAIDPSLADQVDLLAADWQRRRAEFGHDWLRNRFLPRLHACLTLARPGVKAQPTIVENLHSVIREWPMRGAEVLRLIEEFGDVMSPLRWVERIVPSLEPAVASFVRYTTAEIWTIRHCVVAHLDEIRSALGATDRSYDDWTRSGSRDALRQMAGSGERLARALSKLPSRVVL